MKWRTSAACLLTSCIFVPHLARARVSTGAVQVLDSRAQPIIADGSPEFGSSVSAAGDVNADGYADMIVGAPFYPFSSSPVLYGGIALAYYGSPTGFGPVSQWSYSPEATFSFFGRTVGTAGDVNGDGFSDAFGTASQLWDIDATNVKVLVFHGSASGLSTNPSTVIVPPSGGSTYFGEIASTLGDCNGDGFDDFAISDRRYSTYENTTQYVGRISVYYGSSTGIPPVTTWHRRGDSGYDFPSGIDITHADVNGDGFQDMIAGRANRWPGLAPNSGFVDIFLGGADGLSTNPIVITGEAIASRHNGSSVQFGATVCGMGDVDDDGFEDFVVGSPGADGPTGHWYSSGAAILCHGASNGVSSNVTWHVIGPDAPDIAYEFGRIVRNARDVNGDGRTDVLVGATPATYGIESWALKIFQSTNTALSTNEVLWLKRTDGCHSCLATLMTPVDGIGDVNGDGYADIAFGVPIVAGGAGKVFIHYGGPDAPEAGDMVIETNTMIGTSWGVLPGSRYRMQTGAEATWTDLGAVCTARTSQVTTWMNATNSSGQFRIVEP